MQTQTEKTAILNLDNQAHFCGYTTAPFSFQRVETAAPLVVVRYIAERQHMPLPFFSVKGNNTVNMFTFHVSILVKFAIALSR